MLSFPRGLCAPEELREMPSRFTYTAHACIAGGVPQADPEGEDSDTPLPCIRRESLRLRSTPSATPCMADLGHVAKSAAKSGAVDDVSLAQDYNDLDDSGAAVATGALHDTDMQPTQMQARLLPPSHASMLFDEYELLSVLNCWLSRMAPFVGSAGGCILKQ